MREDRDLCIALSRSANFFSIFCKRESAAFDDEEEDDDFVVVVLPPSSQ